MNYKQQLRERMLTQREKLRDDDKLSKSKKIKQNLFEQIEFMKADRIMFYVAFRNEVETEEMIKETIKLGKEVIVPITDKERRKLILSRVKDYDLELEEGAYGILEPKEEARRLVSPQSLELIIVPGVAFDLAGNRLGYGGGYYDRLFSKINSKVPRIALSYELQIIKEIEVEEHDVPVNKLITESRVINCKNNL